MRALVMILAAAALAPSARATCPAGAPPVDAAALQVELDELVATWLSPEREGELSPRSRALNTSLACLDEVLAAEDIPAVHRGFALAAFVRGEEPDLAGVEASLRGMLAADPALDLSGLNVGIGHPLLETFEAARAPLPPETQPLPEGAWVVDGRPDAMELPLGRARVVPAAGDPLQSWYLKGGGLPSALRVVEADPAPEVAPPTPPPNRLARGLTWSGGALAAAWLGSGIIAWSTQRAFEEATAGMSAAEAWAWAGEEGNQSLIDRNRITSVVSPVTGGVAAGLGVGAVIAWRR